jgi:hypothetical protein
MSSSSNTYVTVIRRRSLSSIEQSEIGRNELTAPEPRRPSSRLPMPETAEKGC